ncbi:MAG: DUF4388 domain-containing protein [Polyangiaceae bacterium]|jgi:hypothetical protein|nr:DUF4388 domain-containing protein [Polyangiaceae bacterium]
MSAPAQPLTKQNLDGWGDRITTLENALKRQGHQRLLGPMATLRDFYEWLRSREPTPEAMQALGQALLEVRACVVVPGKEPDGRVFERLRELSRPEEDEAARAMLDSLVDAGEAELEALVASVQPEKQGKPQDDLGTLREPLTTARGQAPPGGRVLMKGELQPGLLTDLLQLFAQNTETGCLMIEGPGHRASIYFRDGSIIDAECKGDVGERGFFRAMMCKEGRFAYQRGVAAPEERIFRNAQHLIMDTLRLIDESSEERP